MMRAHFNEQAHALYVRLVVVTIVDSEEARPGVVLGYDENDQVVGIEILGVKDRIPLENLKQIQFEVA